ncbi:Uncharacterised protein [Pseudomonas putida]|nr:Uncharacterised protein [Pseudomonas putida]
MPWQCGMMLRLQFNNRVALSSCNRPSKQPENLRYSNLITYSSLHNLNFRHGETLDTLACPGSN